MPDLVTSARDRADQLTSGVLEGPWSSAFWVLTGMPLRSKSNFRRGSGSSAWRRNQEFEQSLALSLRAARPLDWPVDEPAVPLASRPVYVAVTFARSTIDAGNHSKSVLDAAEGVVYLNDAQVAASCAVAERGVKDPYLLVAFATVPAGSSIAEVSVAAAALIKSARQVVSSRSS